MTRRLTLSLDSWGSGREDPQRYARECRQAADEPAAFAGFRRGPESGIRSIIETRPAEWAVELWASAAVLWPGVRGQKPLLSRLDEIGGPGDAVEVEPGLFLTATMASFAADFAALRRCFGSLSALGVAEMGGGYGALAAIACNVCRPASYILYDVPEACALQKAYLAAAKTHISGTSWQIDETTTAPDLVISNYCFSELDDETKDRVAELLLRKARCGFMTWHGLARLAGDMAILQRHGAAPGIRCCETIPGWSNRNSSLQFVWGIK